MTTFEAKAVADNFAGWVDHLAPLIEVPLQGTNKLRWFDSKLPHPMYSYGYNHQVEPSEKEVPKEDLGRCISSFFESKTPFYFSNGIWQEGKESGDHLKKLGVDSFGHLDGMIFDLKKDIPQSNLSVNATVKLVENESEYKDFARAIGLASEQPLEVGGRFFASYAKLMESPFQLLTTYVDNNPVGCSMIYLPKGEVAGNYYDWVVPHERKKGINSAMVIERLKLAKNAGYKYLVAQCMGTSTRLYSHLNFEKVCELDFYGKGSYE